MRVIKCRNENSPLRQIVFTLLLILVPGLQLSSALTRWSSLQLVPDADLLAGGTFVVSAHGYYFEDLATGSMIQPAGSINFGIIEWVNIQAGYTGGPNLGIKVRILGETRPWMPSLALGVSNIITHHEAYLYNRLADSLSNELFIVMGKSVEAVRLRIHIGMQSIPDNPLESVNPFIAIEKYFGAGVYATVEVHRRHETIHPSLFASWKLLKRHLEVSAGVIDIAGMFLSDETDPGSTLFTSGSSRFVRPGVWVGLRYQGSLKIGKSGGFSAIEDRFSNQNNSIAALRSEVDSLKNMLQRSSLRIETMDKSLTKIVDSTVTDAGRMETLAMSKLAFLKELYDAEPFEPEAVATNMAELIAYRDRMLPALYAVVLDPIQESRIRSLAVTAVGEIGTQAASDIIIEVLGQVQNPEVLIECLIALGKIKETRAVYLIQQLVNDPNDAVAFTAGEVLQKLEKETGVTVSSLADTGFTPSVSIKEQKIGTGKPYSKTVKRPAIAPPVKTPEALAIPPEDQTADEATDTLQAIDQPDFSTATVPPGTAIPVEAAKLPERVQDSANLSTNMVDVTDTTAAVEKANPVIALQPAEKDTTSPENKNITKKEKKQSKKEKTKSSPKTSANEINW